MTVTYPIDEYYNRHDSTKNYEKHLVRAGYGTQSAEINEIQESQIERLKGVADAFLSDGNIIRDCQAMVNPTTGVAQLNSGAIYLRGAVRGVSPATFTIPVNTVVQIGVRLTETVITELEDPTLRDPATGTRNYDEPGAGRLQVVAAWAWDGDDGAGEFYAVYTVENGVLLSKEAPPSYEGFTNAIARYDRDSAGGCYIIEGLTVSSSLNTETDSLVVLVGEGRARVNGFPIEIPTGLRLTYAADPDLKTVLGEPKTFSPGVGGTMRIELDNGPLVELQEVRVTAEKTVTLTHGAFSGSKDPLPDNAVLALIEVKQGGTTYTQGTDYKLTSGQVDWSLSGAEPAPGSSYTVKYHYQSTTAGIVTGIDSTGYTLSGAVAGSLVTTDYIFALPRIDAVVLDSDGRVTRIKGVASQYALTVPNVPSTQLRIASIQHNWATNPKVLLDAVSVVPMDQIQGIRTMVFDLFDLVAQERLRNDISLADPSAKRGVFVDPFNNDNLRDAGINQNLAIIDGELMLPIDPDVHHVGTTLTTPQLLPWTAEVLISQPYRTGDMLINPYMAFSPIPAQMTLAPAVDFWTAVESVWSSPITRRFDQGAGNRVTTTVSNSVEIVSVTNEQAEFLRQISVKFNITGFGPGEVLQSLTFDGIAVVPEAQ